MFPLLFASSKPDIHPEGRMTTKQERVRNLTPVSRKRPGNLFTNTLKSS